MLQIEPRAPGLEPRRCVVIGSAYVAEERVRGVRQGTFDPELSDDCTLQPAIVADGGHATGEPQGREDASPPDVVGEEVPREAEQLVATFSVEQDADAVATRNVHHREIDREVRRMPWNLETLQENQRIGQRTALSHGDERARHVELAHQRFDVNRLVHRLVFGEHDRVGGDLAGGDARRDGDDG